MKVSTRFLGVGVALFAVAATVLGVYAHSGVTPAAAQDPSDRAKDDAKQSPILSQPATVEAYQQVQVYSRIAGTVKEVMVDIGDRVKRGQLLVVLEAPELELELKQKMALVQQARAGLNQAKSSVQAEQASSAVAMALVLEAEAGVNGARATHDFQTQKVRRLKGLLDAKAIDQSIFDEARKKLDNAQAAWAAREAKWKAAKAAVEESSAKIARAQAEVQVAEARVAVAEVDLQRTQALLQSAQISAPFDGVVTRRSVDVGAFSRAAEQGNAGPLLTVARTDRVRVVVQVPQANIAQITKGTPATVRCNALAGKQFEGIVSRLAQSFDPETRTLRAEIGLLNPDGRLLPGMFGTVVFKVGK